MDLFTQFTILLNLGCTSSSPRRWSVKDIDISIRLTEARSFDHLVRQYCDDYTYSLCPGCTTLRKNIIECLESRQLTALMAAFVNESQHCNKR